MRLHRHFVGILPVLLLATSVAAEPLQLADLRSRWIEVQFEVSPRTAPGRLDSVYTSRIPAWFRPSSVNPRWVIVAIPAADVERELLSQERPVYGSFSDFVWLLDARTGHVVDAELTGSVHRLLDFGFFSREVIAEITVELTTQGAAGFEHARKLFGQHIYPFCAPSDESGCTSVAAIPFDPRRGYVNAVGILAARTTGFTTRVFSSFGEARFLERGEVAPSLASVSAKP